MVWWQGLPDLFADPLARLQAIGGPLLALLLALVLRAFLLRRFGRDPAEPEPSYARRLASAIAEGIATGIVPAFVLGLFLVRTYTEGFLLGGLMAEIVQAFCWAGIFFVLATALPASVLAPETPQWQLVGLPRERIGPIMRRLRILAAIVTVDMFLTGATDRRELGAETIAVYVMVMSLLEGVALLRLVSDRGYGATSRRPTRRRRNRRRPPASTAGRCCAACARWSPSPPSWPPSPATARSPTTC